MLKTLAVMVLFGSASIAYAQTPTIRICAGSETGNYTFAVNEIAKRVSDTVANVEVIHTNGSLDNLRRLMNNECDFGMAQEDVNDMFILENPAALSTIEEFKSIYDEYVHLLCPVASGWRNVTDLRKAINDGEQVRLIVGPDGGGQAETWRSLRRAHEDYDRIERLPNAIDMTAVSTVKDSDDTCMIWVSGLNSASMQAANLSSINTRDGEPSLQLINVEERAMKRLVNSGGEALYEWQEVERIEANQNRGISGQYDNIIRDGWGSDEIEVPTIGATLIVRTDFKEANPAILNRLVIAIEDASPTIWNRVNPR